MASWFSVNGGESRRVESREGRDKWRTPGPPPGADKKLTLSAER